MFDATKINNLSFPYDELSDNGITLLFKGNAGPKTHGQSDRHRAPGAIGAGTTPGRVFKGMRMAGRMGGERVTISNLEVVIVDADRNLLAVKGAIPGAKEGLVMIKEAYQSRIKKGK